MNLSLSAAAAQPSNSPTIHRLSNGLTIIAEQIPIEAISLNVWLNVGSTAESDEINGMAHFLEHMIFKGTAQLRSGEFEKRIEARGAKTNAATSQDYTHYYITTAPKDFADLAPLQADVVMNAAIPEDGFERERHVVLEEIRRSQDNPRRRTFRHAIEVTFEQLPYRRQVLGPSQVIEQLTAQQMRDFHTGHYHPQEITAAVVGNLPVDRLIDIVEQSFNDVMPTRDAAIARQTHAPELPFAAIVRRDLTDSSLQQARLMMTWRVPGLSELEKTYGLDVVASVLAHGRTSRLVQDLRETRGLVSSIGSSNSSYQHQGMFSISAQLPAENLEIVEAAIVEHIQKLQTDLVSEFELRRVGTRVANQFVFGNETPNDRTNLYGYYHALLGDISHAMNYAPKLRSISAEAVRAAAQTYLTTDAYGIVTIRPE